MIYYTIIILVINQEKSLGKTILDNGLDITKSKFNIEKSNNIVKLKVFTDDNSFKKFKNEVQQFENNPVDLDVYLRQHGFDQVAGLKEYIAEQGGQNLKKEPVNELISKQKYSNITSNAHGFVGVNKAIKKYNDLITSGSDDTELFLSKISETNPKLAECMKNFNTGSMNIGNYAGSLIKATAKTFALQTATLALNAGIGLLISSIATYAIRAYDNWIHRIDNAKEALSESMDALDEAKSQYDSVNEKLETCQSRMKELQDLSESGKITLVEQQELDKLKETNEELKRQKALKKDALIQKQQDAVDKNKDLLNKTVTKKMEAPSTDMRSKNPLTYLSMLSLWNSQAHPNATTNATITRTIPETLQDAFNHYNKSKNDLHNGKISSDEFAASVKDDNKDIKKYMDVINDSVEAYQKLIKSGVTLNKTDKEQFNSLKQLQDQYLLYTFTVNGTVEAYQALTKEQKKQATLSKLQDQGLTKDQAKSVVNKMSESDLNKFGEEDFDFAKPDPSKYKNAEEYGKAYYEAMVNGWNDAASSSKNAIKNATKTFDEAWGSLKDSEQKKFTNVVKNGKLTAETFNNIGTSADVLKETGLSVNVLCDNVRSLVMLQTKLENMSTAFKKVGTAYQDFKKNGYVSSNSLNSMPDAFKNLKGYSDFSKVAGNKKSSKSDIQGAFNDIVSEYIETYHILDNLTDKTKDKIITALRDAGVTNANDLIAQYEKVAKANDKLINSAEKNYIKYLNSKGTNNEITNKQINDMNANLINALGKQYQDDYKNWVSLLKQKEKAYNEFVSAYNKASQPAKDLYNTQKESDKTKGVASNKQSMKNLQSGVDSLLSGGTTLAQANALTNQQKKLDETNKKVKEAKEKLKLDLQKVNADYSAEYTPTTSSSGSSGSKKKKSKKDTSKDIDWIERKLTVLQAKIDTTAGKLQNLFSIKAKKNNINKELTETQNLLNANRKAAKAYQKEANKVNLSGKLKAKVRSGDYDITKYDSKTADKITKYQDYIDKAREARDAVQDNIASIHELNQQKLDNIVTWYDKLLAKINAVTSKYQSKSDLTSKIRSMLGQAETGTKTEYKDTLKSQTEALKTSQKEYKAYEKERKAQRKELTGQTNATNRSDRKTTKEFLKRSGLSDAQIKKELKKFDTQRGKLKDKQLDDFDATTKEQSAQLKETVISSLSDMIDTAQDLANIPIEKLQKTLDNLSTDFSKLENQASRASKQLEDVGIGLGYLEKVNASKISNKQTAVNNAATTYRNAVSNRDSLATQLRENGVNPNSIKTSDDLIKFADNTPLASLTTQYLASISTVDSAFKTLNETSEDLRNTIDDVVSSEVDAKNKLLDQDIEESDRQLENWKKEHSYKDNTINNVIPSAYFDSNKDVNKYSGNKINAIIYAAEHSNHADDYSIKADSYRNDANGIANWLKGIHGMYTGSLNSVFSQIEDLTANFEVIPEEILEIIKKEAPDQLPNLVKYNEYKKQSADYSKKVEDAQYTYDYETVPQMYKDIFAAISTDADRTVGDIQDDIDHIENYLQDNLLTDTTDSYMQEASKYKDQADVYEKEVADKEKWLAEAEANGMVKDSDDWNALNDEIETAKKNQEESSRNYTNALVNAFNSIGDIADRSIKEIDKNLSRLNSEISMLEAQGHFITSDFYDQQGDYYAQQQAANEKKASDLQADLDSLVDSGDIKEYSARWYEMKDKIDDATQSALDYGVKVKESTKSAFDAALQLGEKSREAITRMNDEADFYQDILGRDKLVDEKTGAFTSNGLASMSLSYEKMTNDIVNKNNIQREIDRVTKEYANGTNEDYGIERYNEDMDNLLSQQREAIKNYYDERDAVMSLVEDGLNKQLEVLQDIVDKYKEAMDKASDLRDYQNSVDDATKNIASLQKQLEVVRGNDSEEGRATAQSLQKQLEDAQKDLDDLEWDKKKSDMEDILDQMMEDAQDFIDDKLDQITDSIDQIRDLLPENAQEVYDTLKDIDAQWGTQISDNLAEGVKLGDYSTILSGMDSAAAKIAQAVYDAEKAKLERTETPTLTPETPSTDNNSSNGSQSGQTSNDTTSSNSTETKEGLKSFILQHLSQEDKTNENAPSEYRAELDDFIHSLGFKGTISDSQVNKMLTELGDTAATSLPLQYRIDQLKNDLQKRIESIGGFSRGGIVDKINKQIRRNNDDALISVKSGEGILTPQQTAMFQKLVENMPSLVDLSKIKLPTLPSSSNSSKNITVEMGDMHFDLPNVTDTDSFINAWKSDTKLKNFVADVVSGTVTGDNSKAMRY